MANIFKGIEQAVREVTGQAAQERQTAARQAAWDAACDWIQKVYPARKGAMLDQLAKVAKQAKGKNKKGYSTPDGRFVGISDNKSVDDLAIIVARLLAVGPKITEDEAFGDSLTFLPGVLFPYSDRLAFRVDYYVDDRGGISEDICVDSPKLGLAGELGETQLFVDMEWVNGSVAEVEFNIPMKEGVEDVWYRFVLSCKDGLGVSIEADILGGYGYGPRNLNSSKRQKAKEILSSCASRLKYMSDRQAAGLPLR